MKQLIKLTEEKFRDIYTNEEFRNQVAFAHGCCNSDGNFMYKKTCSYPIEYIVTDDQIKEAEAERVRATKQTIKDNKGKLMFVGMGMTYTERYPDDVCNHRIRTEFKNVAGHSFFIEFGTGSGNQMRIDHAVDRDKEREYENKVSQLRTQRETVKRYSDQWNELCNEIEKYSKQVYYNYHGLEHDRDLPKYTKSNILSLVNKEFDCNFSEIVIDNYNVSTDQYISVSPKRKLEIA